MDHEWQHADDPTWCINCGTFRLHGAGKCIPDRSGKWDQRTRFPEMFAAIFGADAEQIAEPVDARGDEEDFDTRL